MYRTNLFRVLLFCVLALFSAFPLYAQKMALKTNALYWGTATLNAGVEFAINNNCLLYTSPSPRDCS